MEITVKVDDVEVSKVVSEGLAALSNEEKKEIVKQCITKYFFEKRIGDTLFKDCYGRPSDRLIDFLKTGFTTDEIAEIRDFVIGTFKENSSTILQNAFAKALISMLVTDRFKDDLNSALACIMSGQVPNTFE